VFTICTFLFLIIICTLISRIKLIMEFMEEAKRILFSMPLIFLEPTLTFLANFIVVALFVVTTVLMATAGTLQESDFNNNWYEYRLNGAMIFAIVFNVIILLWTLQFILGCQQMVISGAVSAFYFTKDKLTLISPIYNSFYNLIRFHLGSVAFGSFIITAVAILKALIRSLARENGFCRLLLCCLQPIENLLKYLTSMGYIEIALHGQPLCRSCMRSFNLIIANVLSAVVINSVSNFVFIMAELIAFGLTIGIGALMRNDDDDGYIWVVIVLGALVALFFAHCFFIVIQIALDTIFICYCEDQSLNDGMVTPYYTSVDFQSHIQKAQDFQKQLESKQKLKQVKK